MNAGGMNARVLSIVLAMTLSVTVGAAAAAGADTDRSAAPELPRAEVDITAANGKGRTIELAATDDLQDALNAAKPGDVLLLQEGATYRGPFTLPRKPEGGWITIHGAAEHSGPGNRLRPHGTPMPRLVATGMAVVTTAPGAHHYRFVGVEVAPTTGSFLHNVVLLGDGTETAEEIPHHIIFDRCYIHGDATAGSRRGIALNGAHLAVVNSIVSDFKEKGADSQAVAGWAGPGPILLQNNYLEAAAENIMFGGADPSIPELVPSDITIRRNRITKLLTWNSHLADGGDTNWSIKNLLELKNARRVLVEGNLFENCWPAAQGGFALVFTVRNQDLSAPWSTLQDVTIVDNIVRNVAAGANILGQDDSGPSRKAERILIRNNLFSDIGLSRGSGILFQILNGTSDLVIENNSSDQTGSIIMAGGAPHARFVYRRNDAPHNEYGVVGTGTRPGRHTLETYFPGALFEANVLRGGDPELYPRGNQFQVMDVSQRARRQESAGRRIGADREAVCKALAPEDVPLDLCGTGALALR